MKVFYSLPPSLPPSPISIWYSPFLLFCRELCFAMCVQPASPIPPVPCTHTCTCTCVCIEVCVFMYKYVYVYCMYMFMLALDLCS